MIGIYLALFFGGAFFVNAIPHFVSALQGRKFPSPFSKPPGRGDSSTIVNFFWGCFNFLLSYLLLCQYMLIDMRSGIQVGIAALGGFLIGLHLSWHFGKLKGGA
jgi:hypothetical protein